MADGSARFIPDGVDPVKLHSLFTAAGREVQRVDDLMPDDDEQDR